MPLRSLSKGAWDKRLVDFGVTGSYWAIENVSSIEKFKFKYMKHNLFGIIKSGHTFGPFVSYKVNKFYWQCPWGLCQKELGKKDS